MDALKVFAKACPGGDFFGLPKWYAYLNGTISSVPPYKCVPEFTNINDTWLIVAAIIEMLLRVAAIIAVFMVIYGGITFTTSQGSPEETAKARNTIIYSLIGLLISISAAILVTFVAKTIGAG